MLYFVFYSSFTLILGQSRFSKVKPFYYVMYVWLFMVMVQYGVFQNINMIERTSLLLAFYYHDVHAYKRKKNYNVFFLPYFGILRHTFQWEFFTNCVFLVSVYYRPFHKTLPRSSSFVNRISVSFYETGCM